MDRQQQQQQQRRRHEAVTTAGGRRDGGGGDEGGAMSASRRGRFDHHDDDGGGRAGPLATAPVVDQADCTAQSCRSCVAVTLADAIALGCCPCAVVSLLGLAFVKAPLAVARRCLRRLRRRRGELRHKKRGCSGTPATAMASSESSTVVGEMQSSLDRVKRQLSTSTRQLLQGPLLKRSDTLRKWNERWVILDPTTGKIEYKVRRSDPDVRGVIVFDSTSTVTLSPMNFHGLAKYDGCCFYIGTPQKKEYFLCAETPSAARAWVSTLHATQLVLQAHKEAVNSLSGNGSAKLGTVATVVAVANATAIEATKEVEAAMKISLREALGSTANKLTKGQLDDLAIMMEALRVKDDELHQLLQDIRARDSTISEIADKLHETAEAAETAASAAHLIDEERRHLSTELEHVKRDHEKEAELCLLRLRESEDKAKHLAVERGHLLTERDSALHEVQMWRSELGKARGNAVILEAAVVRAEEKARVSAADADKRIKEAVSRLESATKEKDDLLALVDALRLQIKRQETNTIQVCEDSSELCSTASKHVEDDNVDKACLSDTDPIPLAENIVELDDGVDIRTVRDTEWGNLHSSEVSDVREVTTEPEDSSLDIPVDT